MGLPDQEMLTGGSLPSDGVRPIKGELLVYRASPTARRHFCGLCASPIFFERPVRPWSAIVLGSLNHPNILKPPIMFAGKAP